MDISLEVFASQWSGGALGFQRVNTALTYFSILAREHKIEVTQERLIHEFGLTDEEIAKATLLKMGRGLCPLKKCCKNLIRYSAILRKSKMTGPKKQA